ncbi:MAG TPA: SurA N-terminal domain-containing protein [Actinomycetales bacterium]|nr:SurA N-terminal domain-containing protein [Actinomycetales bacterium]
MSPRTTRRIAVAALAATFAGGLTACSPEQTGAAATVGGRSVSVADLHDAVEGVKSGNPDLAQVEGLDRYLLFDLIAAPYMLQAASDAGMGVSTDEAAAALPKSHDPDPSAVRALQTQIAFQNLRQANDMQALEKVRDELVRAGVTVNPRFGSFDPSGVTEVNKPTIVDHQPNWLSQTPAPTPSS